MIFRDVVARVAERRSRTPRGARGRVRAVAVVASLTLVMAGYGGIGPVSTASAAGSKSSIVVAVPALATTLDGVVGGDGDSLEDFEMNANLQAGLVRNPYVPAQTPGTVIQDFNKYVPYLAQSYSVSTNGLVYTFHLRHNLLSQVGDKITAADVMYSFQRKWASPFYSTTVWTGFKGPSAMKVVNPYTIQFTLEDAAFGQTFLGLLANLQGHIYDSTLLKKHATKADPWSLNWAKTNSGWGLGAYMVTSWVPDQQMVLTAQPHYVLGTPRIKTVTLKVVPDAGTRAELVETGAADMAEGTLASDQVKLEHASGVTVPSVTDPIEYDDLTLVTNKAPFNNELVRQAMAYATPYNQIISQVYGGRAKRMVGNVNPSTAGYSTKGLPVYQYDPAKAKALLAKAGFPKGLSFTLDVSTATSDLVNASVLIKSYAAAAGFDISISQQTATAFADGRSNATYQALIYLNRAQVQTPGYTTSTFFHPNNDLNNPSRWEDTANAAYWKVLDVALDSRNQLAPQTDMLWEKAESMLLTATPEIFIANLQPSQVYRSTIKGFAYRSENAIDFANLTDS